MMQTMSFDMWCKKHGYNDSMNFFEFLDSMFMLPFMAFGYESSYMSRKKSLYGRYNSEMESLR